MLVTPEGRVISRKLSHSAKAKSPILVTLEGRMISCKLLQQLKASYPILVTPEEITNFLSSFP